MSDYRKSQFVSSTWRKLAACSLVSAGALLTACGQSQQSSAPTNPPAADASKDASKPADNGKQLSVAELTGQPSDPNQAPASSPPINPPLNQPANAQAQSPMPQQPMANAPDRMVDSAARQDGRPSTQSGMLASAGYVPHPSNAAPVAGPNTATPPPPPVYDGPIDETRFVRVISVTQLTQPQRVCSNDTVTERRPQGDRHQVAGTVIGAIAGGVIGHQIGGGRGRDLATVGGAVGGGLVGKEIQRSHQEGDVVTRTVQHCRTVTPGRDVVALYDVVYAYQGQNFHVKLDHDPGDRIPLPVRGIDVASDLRH